MTSLDDLIDQRVDARLRALGISANARPHTRENLPSGFTSGEAWTKRCRVLAKGGHLSSEYRSARGWCVPVDAWITALASSRRPDHTDDVDRVLLDHGLRLVRRA